MRKSLVRAVDSFLAVRLPGGISKGDSLIINLTTIKRPTPMELGYVARRMLDAVPPGIPVSVKAVGEVDMEINVIRHQHTS